MYTRTHLLTSNTLTGIRSGLPGSPSSKTEPGLLGGNARSGRRPEYGRSASCRLPPVRRVATRAPRARCATGPAQLRRHPHSNQLSQPHWGLHGLPPGPARLKVPHQGPSSPTAFGVV